MGGSEQRTEGHMGKVEDVSDCRGEVAPLGAAQEALWYTQQALGETPLTIAQYIDISGDLESETLRSAAAAVGRVIGTTISRVNMDEGRPVLHIADDASSAAFEVIDLRTEGDPIGAAHTMMGQWCVAPLSLDTDRLVRSVLFRVGDRRWFLFSRAHHIVLDGFGAYILLTRIAREYQARTAGHDHSALSGSGDSVADFQNALVAHEADYRASARFERDREYWTGVMRTLPAPVTLARLPAAPSLTPTRTTGQLSAELTAALGRAAERPGHNRTAIIVAALSLYLAQVSGQSAVAMMLPVAARVTGKLRKGAGSVSNLVPLVVEVDECMTVSDLVAEVTAAVTGALRHQTYRWEDILRDRGSVSAGITHVGPVMNIFPEVPAVDLGEKLTATYHVLSTGPVADLNFNIYPSGDGGSPIIDIEANPHCHDPSTVELHHENLIELLDQMCRAPSDVRVGRIRVAAPSHLDGKPPPAPASLTELLVTHRESNRPAVIDGELLMSHRELAAAAGRLAITLQTRGIGPEDTVAVVLPRSIAEVVAFHAVAAVGACYVPIDPRYPQVRQEYVLTACEASVVLCSNMSPPVARSAIPTLELGPLGEHDHAGEFGGVVLAGTSPQRAAYLIFTSGATGTPKGVVVTDAGLSALADEINRSYGLAPDSVIGHMSSPAFDTMVVEMLTSAISGGTMVVVPQSHYGGADLARYLTDDGVTHLMITPGVLATLDAAEIRTVSHLIVGGDVCVPDVIGPFAGQTVLRCAYGPTETTCSITMTDPIDPSEISSLPLPIGRPMAGVKARVYDRRLRPVPPGVGGDLYVSGPAVARGYLAQPALTAAAFVADPGDPGVRMYRTGDRVARRADGSLDFLGRSDNQVKIRGNRVEPAEVDAVLQSFPEVGVAITVAVRRRRSLQLVSYVTTPSTTISSNVLRDKVAAELPPHMVPTSVTVLEQIPLTPTGKIDRSALPAPTYAASAPYRAAATADEQPIVTAFAVATGVAIVGADDDFFELGGDSLSATILAAEINSSGRTEVTVRDVFELRTPAALARRMGDASAGPPVRHRDEHRGPHPLAPAQRNVDLDGPIRGALIPFTVQLEAELDPQVLTRAASTVVADQLGLRARVVDGVMVIDPGDMAAPVVMLADAEAAVDDFLDTPIDLENDRPIRIGIHVSTKRTTVAICAHHMFVDGWSLGVIARQLVSAYFESASGTVPLRHEPPAVNYLDYAVWAADRLGHPGDPESLHHKQLTFWRSELQSVPRPFDIAGARPRPDPWKHDGARVRIGLGDVWQMVRAVAAVHAVSTSTVLRASLARLLCRTAAADVVAIGALVSGRIDNHFDDVVGMFVNTVAVVCKADDGDNSAHLAEVAGAELRAFSNADIPFADLGAALAEKGSAHPIFQVMLTVESRTPTTELARNGSLSDLTVTPRPPDIAKCDLHLAITEGDDGYVDVLYPTSMWDPSTIATLVKGWFDDLRRYPGAAE